MAWCKSSLARVRSKELLFEKATEGQQVTLKSFEAFVAWIAEDAEGSEVLFLPQEVEARGSKRSL